MFGFETTESAQTVQRLIVLLTIRLPAFNLTSALALQITTPDWRNSEFQIF